MESIRFSRPLPRASEVSVVLFAAAVAAGALAGETAAMATRVAAVSMAATPVLFAVSERFPIPRPGVEPAPEYDAIPPENAPVIICGFGRMGQIVGRVPRRHGIPFTALESGPGQVDVVRRFGNKVYFGDPTRPDLLRAAGAEQAKRLIVALDEMAAVLRTVEVARRNVPNLKVFARARNRRHALLLMDRNVDGLVRDTFHSSLRLAEDSLVALGIPAEDAAHSVELFREHDERNLVEAHAIYRDEKHLVQSSQQAAEELTSLFEADRRGEAPRRAIMGARTT